MTGAKNESLLFSATINSKKKMAHISVTFSINLCLCQWQNDKEIPSLAIVGTMFVLEYETEVKVGWLIIKNGAFYPLLQFF